MGIEQEIQAWFTQRGSFAAGVDLYRRLGQKAFLTELTQATQKPYIPPGARERLESLLLPYVPAPVTTTTAAIARPEEPESVQMLREQGRSLKKREAFIHAQMVLLAKEPDSPDRAKRLHDLAREMMEEVMPMLSNIYDALKEFDKFGRVPMSNEQQVIKDTVAKMRLRDSLNTQVYKLRKRLKQATTEEEREKLTAILAEREQAWRDLDKELFIITEEDDA